MSIHTFAQKIKGWTREEQKKLILIGILIGVSLFSYYLGYAAHSAAAEEAPVVINCPLNAFISGTELSDYSSLGQSAFSGTKETIGSFVASKNGTKYYPQDCPGASRIKPENRVSFTSQKEAEKAGYTAASGC